MALARAFLAEATTGLGVVDYALLTAALAERNAPDAVWHAVGLVLRARGEGAAWERHLGLRYPLESPTVLPERRSEE